MATQRKFVSLAPSEMAMFDQEMRYIAASRSWLSMYALPPDVLGRSHYALLPDKPERWRLVHRRAMAGEILNARKDRVEWDTGTIR